MSNTQAETLARQEEDEARHLSGLKTLFDPATLVRKGLCPISKMNGETSLTSHSLYYEQHGRGPQKIVFIMGLNTTSFAWEGQVKHFAALEKYSLLVFDNRGVGNSDTPRGPYSSSAMAADALTLLDYLGWTEDRSLHVVGISLGGMISLELATVIPQRFASLTLMVTSAGNIPRPFGNISPSKGTRTLLKMLTVKEPKDKVPYVLEMMYPKSYLDATDPKTGITNREMQEKAYARRIEYTRPQALIGNLSQTMAALTHYVSPSRLQQIEASIPKIAIITGDDDYVVYPSNSKKLSQAMPSAEYVVWEKTGHALPGQWPERTAKFLESVFEEGWNKARAQMDAVAPAGTSSA